MAKVRELLLAKPPAIISIHPDEPVLAAIQMMADHGIGALLVMKDGELAGIVSERDYARKVILLGRSSADTPVWQIMSAPVTTVAPDTTTQSCMVLMTEGKFRHLPVIDAGRVIGMLSVGDLIKHALAEKQHEIDQLQRYIAS
ncbi:MAG TPA: CBS domain-containing protein [Patescibacteria group bacterium]|nr:CBS domain-containing protein [Patescibacteria group bacterium]